LLSGPLKEEVFRFADDPYWVNRGDDLDPRRTVVVQGDVDRHQLLDDPGDRPQVLRQPGTGERRRAVGERRSARHERGAGA
jgi:hypothetical protein